MMQALSDGTSALTDLRVAVRMDDRAQTALRSMPYCPSARPGGQRLNGPA
jgi:hypothetical protein